MYTPSQLAHLVHCVLHGLRGLPSDEGMQRLVLSGLGQAEPAELALLRGSLPSNHDLCVGLLCVCVSVSVCVCVCVCVCE